jgi:hypothetical protein
MDVLRKIKKSIKKNDESAVDTLLFISKIESLKQDKKDSNLFDSVAQLVKGFYQSKYKIPYSKEAKSLYGYIGKEIDQVFYNLNEIDAKGHELLTDKIVKRMQQIKESSCSFDYKFNSLVLLYEYLKELSPENNVEANILLGKMLCKKAVMKVLFFLFLSYSLWLPDVVSHFTEMVNGTPKELIYVSLIMKIVNLIVFGTAFLYIYFKGILKKLASFVLVTLLIYTSITVPNYVIDIKTDISQYHEETVVFDSITQSNNNKDAKCVVVKHDNGQKETLMFHSDMGLESKKTYTIKYNKTGIIVSATEVE